MLLVFVHCRASASFGDFKPPTYPKSEQDMVLLRKVINHPADPRMRFLFEHVEEDIMDKVIYILCKSISVMFEELLE